jgi:hypothetical protein
VCYTVITTIERKTTMGLDQYLSVKRYYSNTGFFGENNSKVFENVVTAADMDKFTHKNNENFNSCHVEVQCCYWRKANHIHKWFVDNVQRGDDNCAQYYVSRDDLQELVNVCNAVIANPEKAEELLPSQSGFFFGSTDYDEWYLQDVQYTAERLTELLQIARSENEENGFVEFYYSSSW